MRNLTCHQLEEMWLTYIILIVSVMKRYLDNCNCIVLFGGILRMTICRKSCMYNIMTKFTCEKKEDRLMRANVSPFRNFLEFPL